MALAWSRVLAVARRGFRFPLQEAHYSSRRVASTDLSNSNPLLLRLLQEPSLSVKTLLDSQDSALTGSSPLSWKTLVTSLKSSSSPKKAQLVLEWRLGKMSKDSEGDLDCYIDLIRQCGELQNFRLAMRVFTAMEFQGVKPTVTVFNSLVEACLSSHNMITAFSIFEVMQNSESCNPNSDTFNLYILAFAKLRDIDAMRAWYSAKKAFGFSTDLQTYESLISGSVKSKGYDFAYRCFEEMMVSGIVPSTIILENMLEGLCKRKSLDEVKKFFNIVFDHGWEINRNMVDMFIQLCYESGKVEEMEELLTKLNKSNPAPDVVSQLYCGIIRMHVMSNSLDEVEYYVERMLKRGLAFECADDVEKVICAYFRVEAYGRLDLFIDCLKGNYMLTKSTFDLLVAGYQRAGLSERVDLVLKDMKLAGIS